MEIILYHGSEQIIIPEYGKGKPYNDYGRGLYCTENLDLAKEWACGHGKDGYVNALLLTVDGLKVLNLNDEQFNILNWLAILLDNRKFATNGPVAMRAKEYILENFLPEYKSYDMIKGYRADDSYFSFAGDFISNSLSINGLKEAMSLGSLGEQVVIKSEKAFGQLQVMEPSAVPAEVYFGKYAERDKQARKRYYDISRQQFSSDELYVLDIIRRKIKNGDPRL